MLTTRLLTPSGRAHSQGQPSVEKWGGGSGTAPLAPVLEPEKRAGEHCPVPASSRAPGPLRSPVLEPGRGEKTGRGGGPFHRSFQTIRRAIIVNMDKLRKWGANQS